jgi:hypothetical protein
MCTSRDQKQLDETKLKSEQPRKKRGGVSSWRSQNVAVCVLFVCTSCSWIAM